MLRIFNPSTVQKNLVTMINIKQRLMSAAAHSTVKITFITVSSKQHGSRLTVATIGFF